MTRVVYLCVCENATPSSRAKMSVLFCCRMISEQKCLSAIKTSLSGSSYQQCFIPLQMAQVKDFKVGWLMGFEPTASASTKRRSNQLSYSHHKQLTPVFRILRLSLLDYNVLIRSFPLKSYYKPLDRVILQYVLFVINSINTLQYLIKQK